MNRVLVVFSDGLLSELDSARHETPRSAWIRRAVEERLMKEATAPLVPDGSSFADWNSPEDAAYDEVPEETEILDRMHGITEEVSVAQQAEQPSPKRQVRGSKPRGGARKGSPAVRVQGRDLAPSAESPSPKPRKPKTCTHSNTIRKLGQPFCTDCGEFV